MAIDLVRADPELTGVCLDIAAAIVLAGARAAEADATDRLRFVPGDAFAR